MTNPHESPRPHAKRARDLDPSEEPMAAWFSSLERLDAPASLRARILSAPALARRPAGRLVQMFPLGGWGMATAALLLLAFGTVAWVETTDAISPGTGAVAPIATQPVESLVIVEDPTMPLFHDLETFDEVGLAPDELIADWSR